MGLRSRWWGHFCWQALFFLPCRYLCADCFSASGCCWEPRQCSGHISQKPPLSSDPTDAPNGQAGRHVETFGISHLCTQQSKWGACRAQLGLGEWHWREREGMHRYSNALGLCLVVQAIVSSFQLCSLFHSLNNFCPCFTLLYSIVVLGSDKRECSFPHSLQ